VCTVNAARVLDVTARMLGTDAAGLADRALAAAPGAGGLVLLPYLDGERTPNRPAANGVLRGLTTHNATQENLARAAVEAVLCSLADAIDHVTLVTGVAPRRVVLIGGAVRSAAIRTLAPAIFGVPVAVPVPAEDVALGAARQAAWALAGTASPPEWPARPAAAYEADPLPHVREQYASLRDDAAAWQCLCGSSDSNCAGAAPRWRRCLGAEAGACGLAVLGCRAVGLAILDNISIISTSLMHRQATRITIVCLTAGNWLLTPLRQRVYGALIR